jgi:hypothetical protein
MTELVLKNKIDKRKLDSIIHFLKSWDIDVEVKNTRVNKVRKKDIFADVRGIWANRDIDAKTLREQAWNIKNN